MADTSVGLRTIGIRMGDTVRLNSGERYTCHFELACSVLAAYPVFINGPRARMHHFHEFDEKT